MSQICALTVLPSTLMLRVANSTPMVDLDSRLNSLRVKRERTGECQLHEFSLSMSAKAGLVGAWRRRRQGEMERGARTRTAPRIE